MTIPKTRPHPSSDRNHPGAGDYENPQLGSLGREQGAGPLTFASLPPEVDHQSQNCDFEHSAGHCHADHNFITQGPKL